MSCNINTVSIVRCKKYHQKQKEVYQEKHALRKRNYSHKMKANPIANEERLRVQREKKQKYWQRVKESIATATAAKLRQNKTMTLLFRKPT